MKLDPAKLFALLAAGLITAIRTADSHDIRLALASAGVCAGVFLVSLIDNPRNEPYYIARWLFYFVLMCSWLVDSSAQDHNLRLGARITGLIAAAGSLIAFEMKLRAERKNRGPAR